MMDALITRFHRGRCRNQNQMESIDELDGGIESSEIDGGNGLHFPTAYFPHVDFLTRYRHVLYSVDLLKLRGTFLLFSASVRRKTLVYSSAYFDEGDNELMLELL